MSEGLVGDAAHDGMDKGTMDREELQRPNLASRWQPTCSHPSLVQWHCITAFGDLGGHRADHEILAVDDEHEGGAAFDRRQVREGESDGNQGTWAQSDRDPPSHVVPDVVLGVSP